MALKAYYTYCRSGLRLQRCLRLTALRVHGSVEHLCRLLSMNLNLRILVF